MVSDEGEFVEKTEIEEEEENEEGPLDQEVS